MNLKQHAASISRFRLNCRVICVRPSVLTELMESRPEIVENCFSSGVATVAAIVSGLAPARLAETTMVGKSTGGRSLTDSDRYPMKPKIRMPIITRVVVTGLRMKSPDMFRTTPSPLAALRALYSPRRLHPALPSAWLL